jgi:pimeloyl-ACP methyl ester carboxylesterase
MKDECLTLSDGRDLAYAEYGDLHGKPVFFFNGTPGSRMFHPSEEITTRLGVRLICTDRPGYGGSTFQSNRRLLDWPNDISQLADSLGIDKFAVVGHSGGGPHTLACAYALPERVTAAAILSSAGPVDAPGATDGMTLLNWFGFKFGQYIPWPLGRLLTWWLFHERAADPAKAMDRDIGHRPPADDKIFAQPEVREVCLQSEREAFRPGMLGFTWDVRLITRPWGFPLEEIKVPVHLWHGTADDSTSIRMARYMAGKIPNCKITICESEGHMLLIPHWEEILTALLT